MGPPAFVHTNILIDFAVGVPAAASELARYTDLAVSVISRIEMLAGPPADKRAKGEAFLAHFLQIELTPEIADEAVNVRHQEWLKLPDAILLATARVEKRVLLTRNAKDFKPGAACADSV